ncbi:hypothetical protein L226DRAFT_457815 [Lentinus tigrinus ALCF2SS1-7]|uniref:uncharacterized protein n=1 Tax=Lentinus tigrinus ALCF2SS1-7 TaxID=1328758 RepID=UPI001165D659|nr:hypothetical protein L226DRAFT_457815 [Lentinus tigrinus ALCF2SS1-7]
MRPPSATGLFIFHDTGPPRGSRDYTTLVIVHGHSWHSGVFAPLLPYARQTNTRIILVNRRDYPGAAPYTASELALLPLSVEDLDLTQEPDELEGIKVSISFFMKHRGHELLRFLTGVVRDCNIPLGDPRRNAGGIVLVGWSLGVLWANALLAHAASFHHDDVNLSRYLRRVVLYDGPSFLFGFPRPDNAFNPYLDPRPDADSDDRYDWVSGYFTHGDTLETLSMHTPARDQPPTMARMTTAELARCLHRAPGDEGGSDELLVVGGHRTGAFGDLWQAALELAGPRAVGDRNDLREVEVRVVWCDRSTWETTHAAWCVAAELEGAREKGRLVRKVTLARVRGANHFVHWDDPEIALQAFLCDTGETEEGVYDT